MAEGPKRRGPLRWASKLLRLPNPDYDAWSDSSLQDIEWVVRKACVCASENAHGSHGEFLAARERLLEEWLGQCDAVCAGRSEYWRPSKSSGGVLSLAHVRGQAARENECGIQRCHSTPVSYILPQRARTGRPIQRKMLTAGPRSSSDNSCENLPSQTSKMERDDFLPELSLDNSVLRPIQVKSFKSKMQRAFRKGDGVSAHEESCTSPLLSDF